MIEIIIAAIITILVLPLLFKPVYLFCVYWLICVEDMIDTIKDKFK
jgi:hypothetical protein